MLFRSEKEDEYGYNRYLDSLHLKASEIFTLQTEAEFKVREAEKIEIARKLIINGANDDLINASTNLTIEQIVELRNKLNK